MKTELINQEFGMTEITQAYHLRNFVKLSVEDRLKVMCFKNKYFYILNQSKNHKFNKETLSYFALLQAIDKYYSNMPLTKKRSIDIKYVSRKLSKSEKILNRWALVKELKEVQGLSFERIAKYLSSYEKVDCVASTVYNVWKTVNKKESKGKKDD